MFRISNYVPFALAAALLLFAASCRKPSSDEEAIRAAILQHLQKASTINLSAMDTSFGQITVARDRAQAQVMFKAKGEGATMQMTYALERRDGQWTVLGSHPTGGQMAHPPIDATHGNGPAPGGAPGPGSDLPHLQVPTAPAQNPSKP